MKNASLPVRRIQVVYPCQHLNCSRRATQEQFMNSIFRPLIVSHQSPLASLSMTRFGLRGNLQINL